MTFEFTDEMIVTALYANGWALGWSDDDWVHETMSIPDRSGMKKEEAFRCLLRKSNLI